MMVAFWTIIEIVSPAELADIKWVAEDLLPTLLANRVPPGVAVAALLGGSGPGFEGMIALGKLVKGLASYLGIRFVDDDLFVFIAPVAQGQFAAGEAAGFCLLELAFDDFAAQVGAVKLVDGADDAGDHAVLRAVVVQERLGDGEDTFAGLFQLVAIAQQVEQVARDAVRFVDQDRVGEAEFDYLDHFLEDWPLVGAGRLAGLDIDPDDLVALLAGPLPAGLFLGVERVAADLFLAADAGVDDDFHPGTTAPGILWFRRRVVRPDIGPRHRWPQAH